MQDFLLFVFLRENAYLRDIGGGDLCWPDPRYGDLELRRSLRTYDGGGDRDRLLLR